MCEVDWTLFLEFVKVLLSWPPIIAILAIWFMSIFRQKIETLLDDLEEIDWKGAKAKRRSREPQSAVEPPKLELPGAADPSAQPAAHEQTTGGLLDTVNAQNAGAPNTQVSEESRLVMGPDANFDAAITYVLQNPGPALDEYIQQTFVASSERTFANIFGTQIEMLEFLNVAETPTPLGAVTKFYDTHFERAKHHDQKITFEHFVGFLGIAGFTINIGPVDGPLLQITHRGKRFLTYIKQFYPRTWNTQAL